MATALSADLSKDGRRLTPSKWSWLSCVRLSNASFFLQQSTLSGCEWKCSSSASCGDSTKWEVCSPRGTAISRELPAYLNALDEVPHGEVVVEENTHQHLHHFLVELEREVRRQDQLDTRNRRDEKLTLIKFLGSVTLKTCCGCAVTLSMTVARC